MTEHRRGLDDPDQAAFAWARYRLLLAWMIVVAGVVVIATLIALGAIYGPLSVMARVAVVLGIGGSVVMAAALMGLAFLSSGTGHDESVDRRD
jgi:hypothetical protein